MRVCAKFTATAQFINRHRSSLLLSENFGCVQRRRRRLNWMRAHIKNVFIKEQQPNGAAEIPSQRNKKNWKYIKFERNKKTIARTINSTRFTVRFTRHPKYARQKAIFGGREKLRNTKIYREQSMRERKRFVCYRASVSSHMDACWTGQIYQLLCSLLAGKLECVS